MARFREIADAAMDAEQKRVAEEMRAGPRGRLSPPLHVWLKRPALAEPAHRLGEFVRFRSALSPRLTEIAILVSAQFWRAQFEGWAHERLAREAGVEEAIITAIRAGRRPDFANEDDALVFDLASTILTKKRLDDALFARASGRFGEEGIVDLVGLLGYYATVSMTLNAFEVPVPDGKLPYAE